MNRFGFLVFLVSAILNGCDGGSSAGSGSSGTASSSTPVVTTARSSGNYVVAFDTVAAQGGEMSSSAYRLRSVAGQAAPVGTMSSNSYVLNSGYEPQKR